MNLFSRAAQNLNLTPGERAFLKLLKGWFYTALAAGIAIGVQYLYSNQVIDWQKLGYLVGGAILVSLLMALEKYFTAQGDAPLATAAKTTKEKVDQNLPQGQAQPTAAQAQHLDGSSSSVSPNVQSLAPTLAGKGQNNAGGPAA